MTSSPVIQVIAYKEANEAKTKRINEWLDRQERDLFTDTLFCADKNEVDRPCFLMVKIFPKGRSHIAEGL